MARTARQRAAQRKASLASARKRRGRGKGRIARANATSRGARARRSKTARRVDKALGAAVAGVSIAAIGTTGYMVNKQRRPKRR